VKQLFYKFISPIFILFIFSQGLNFSCVSDNPSKIFVKKVKSILEKVSTYKYGESRSWLQEYNDIMAEVYNMPDVYEDVEKLMLNVLKSKASYDAKLLVCKSLSTFGGDASIPVLEKLLKDTATSHMALIAFTTIPGEKIDEILINALAEVGHDQLIGIINSLGIRRSASAIMPLSKYLQDENHQIASVAIKALGSIGGEEAAHLLFDAFLTNDVEHKWEMAEALLKCTVGLSPDLQMNYYREIYNGDPQISIKFAAFKGIVECTDENERSGFLLQTLNSSAQEFQEALMPLIRSLPGSADMNEYVESITSFPETIQGQLMLVVSDRKDRSVRPLTLVWIKDIKPEKRIIGLKCLKNVSGPGDIPLLAGIAARSSGEEKELARECLYWMEGEDVNSSVLSTLKNSGDVIKPELIRCVGYRKIEEGNVLVLDFLNSNNSKIRREAIETLGKIGIKDDLQKMVDWVVQQANKSELELIIGAVTNIALNFEIQDEAIELIGNKLMKTTSELPQLVFIEVLGNIGGDHALRIIHPYVMSEDQNIQFTALKVFSSWENDLPLQDLEMIIQSEVPQRNRSQAIAGITYLVQNSTDLNQDQKSTKLENAYAYAQNDQDKKIIINGISRIESLKALDFVIKQLNDPGIKEEVHEAVIRIAGNLRSYHQKEIQHRMDSLLENTDNEEFKEKINILQKSMDI